MTPPSPRAVSDWVSTEAPRVLARLLPRLRARIEDPERWEVFRSCLEESIEPLLRAYHRLYGWRFDLAWQLEDLLLIAADAAAERPQPMWRRDLEESDDWMRDERTVWAMVYTERFAGDLAGVSKHIDHLQSLGLTHLHLMPLYAVPEGRSDGGYAVSDYRAVRRDLGNIEELRDLISTLSQHGISMVLDFVVNHTSDNHPWARAAKAGDPTYQAYYWMFDDRTEPDRWEPHLRKIFPERGGTAFTWRPDVAGPNRGKWVWTTFYEFQWDLNYRNPEVLSAMAAELLFLINLGPAVIRMDATPFIWKELGTSCENRPEAHVLLRILNLVSRLVAPSVRFLSEAIVHPDDVVAFVSPDECQLAYNPLVMALSWEALATGNVTLLADALDRRARLPEGCQWITYLRVHDDIGWGFADEDAARLGVDPQGHRDFLNAFYTGEFEGSFARGMRFQHNLDTGDARVSGTLASLAGLEAALESGDPTEVDLAVRRILALFTVMLTSVGVPLLYLGDEIGQLNDHRYAEDPLLASDNRWAHRPFFDWDLLAKAERGEGPQAALLTGVRRLIDVRTSSPAFGEGTLAVLPTGAGGVLAYRRVGRGEEAVVAVNLAQEPQEVFLPIGHGWTDALSGESDPVIDHLEPYEHRILIRSQTSNDS